MANLPIPGGGLAWAQGAASGCSAKMIHPYIKKEGKVYSLVGAPDKIRALSDKCCALYQVSEPELWKKIDEFRENVLKRVLNTDERPIARIELFPEIAKNPSKETILRTCQILTDCIDLSNSQIERESLQKVLASVCMLFAM
jgi:hypothetical protein